MIRISYGTGKRSIIRVSGHAGYAPEGQDIVCAGVSALYCTLKMARGVNEVTRREMGTDFHQLEYEGGDGRMHELFELFASGMEAIAGEHPEHVMYLDGLDTEDPWNPLMLL